SPIMYQFLGACDYKALSINRVIPNLIVALFPNAP
ncbi:hypothetical protein A2U01_0105482, partial [Trifolium medium]|nr:hypothetical protein [Trifolium medium]